MPLDKLGNKLSEGCLVLIDLRENQHYIVGRVNDMTEGGISLIGGTQGPQKQQQVTMGQVSVIAEIPGLVDPRTGICSSILRLTDHNPEEIKNFLKIFGKELKQ